MVREGLTGKVIFGQRLKEIREQAVWFSEVRLLQAERKANSKVLRQET